MFVSENFHETEVLTTFHIYICHWFNRLPVGLTHVFNKFIFIEMLLYLYLMLTCFSGSSFILKFYKKQLRIHQHSNWLNFQKVNLWTNTKSSPPIYKLSLVSMVVPTMYWLPKLHKSPYEYRFISSSSHCSTTSFSILFTRALNTIKIWL